MPLGYFENISRLYEQVSRTGRNFGHIPLSEKMSYTQFYRIEG